jgi:uncharacterized membrane protein YphA (DoxX/SURF4 family)
MSNYQAKLILRVALGFVWIFTGLVCIGVTDEGRELIGRVGFHGLAADWTIRLTSGFEVLLGFAVILGVWPRLVASIQIGLIAIFTLIVTVFLSDVWLHPFGPISKNIVLIAAACVSGWLPAKLPSENCIG